MHVMCDLRIMRTSAVTELQSSGHREFSGGSEPRAVSWQQKADMQTILTGEGKPAPLRSGVQRAIASSADDATLATELELVSILDGPAFHGSSRSRAFLRFVVEEALAGRQELLKERTIGVSVMGKPSDYDTGADSTVRVRANEVRKRLAAHYDATAPKAGIRIELPLGTYAPRFTPLKAQPPGAVAPQASPPPMLLWQLAIPTLIAVFLALAAIRGGVESSDAFSRFWDQAMTGRTEVTVVVDSQTGTSISPAMADAAMPIEKLAETFQVPVHVVAAGSKPQPGSYVIRLSLTEKPAGRQSIRMDRATLFLGGPREHAVWLWAENSEALRAAAQTLTSRSGFPEIE